MLEGSFYTGSFGSAHDRRYIGLTSLDMEVLIEKILPAELTSPAPATTPATEPTPQPKPDANGWQRWSKPRRF